MSSYIISDYLAHSPEVEPYKSMIYSQFMRSLRWGNDWYKLIDQDSFYAYYQKYIAYLLNRNDSVVKVANLDDEIKTCVGFSLFENKTLHYVYVKKDVRRQGLCRALLPYDFNTVTHLTKEGLRLKKKYYSHVKFNPFLL